MADSADVGLTCGAITASGDVTIGSATEYISIGSSTASVIGAYSNALGYSYQLIGDSTSSAGPAIFRFGAGGTTEWRSTNRSDSGTTDLAFGRDSAGVLGIYTSTAKTTKGALTCGAITASGAVMETPTQSTINPTTVNIPTGQRRGWYNSTLAEFRDWVNIGGTLMKSAAYT